MKEIIFYGSYLVFPFLAYIIWSKRLSITIRVILIILSIIFVWSRFIEPYTIRIQHTEIELGFQAKIALVADLHIGKYKKKSYVEKLVHTLNTLEVDMVLIAGDFTYYPKKGSLKEIFSPFKDLKHTTYWVLGNHDVEQPGPPLRDELIKALDYEHLHYLNNDVKKISGITLIGLGSHWNREDDTSLLDTYTQQDNIIVLTHNPDTVSKYTNYHADITLVGHTHGGQIRIPWLYKYAIPTRGDFDRGLSTEKYGLLYITAGVGETGLPMRFLNPPTIDILNIKK
ncbi:metallophosphoesterase [Candidatus Gracilibacteria bacterium]|nr:metallophosphoesterase [Candidatus Gracilibacteria bacterium]